MKYAKENKGIKMELKFDDKEKYEKLWGFLVETFCFTDEQCAAIDHQIPMTQEIFDSILDRCAEIGKTANDLFYRMLNEYPDYTVVRGERILSKLEPENINPLSEEEMESWRQKLYAKIRAKYGEDAI